MAMAMATATAREEVAQAEAGAGAKRAHSGAAAEGLARLLAAEARPLDRIGALAFADARALAGLAAASKAHWHAARVEAATRLTARGEVNPSGRKRFCPLRELFVLEKLKEAADPAARKRVACGEMHSVFRCASGLVGMGDGYAGRLGGERTESIAWDPAWRAVPVFQGIAPRRVKQVSCGTFHTAVLTVDADLFVFGELGRGTLPQPPQGRTRVVEYRAPGEAPTQICSGSHSLAWATRDGSAFALDRVSQLRRVTGCRVDGFGPRGPLGLAKQAAAGDRHYAVVTEAGDLYTWGYGAFGRLGHGSEESMEAPARVGALCEALRKVGDAVASCAVGWRHSAVVTRQGRLFTFGCGEQGQLGTGDHFDRVLPVQVSVPPICDGRVIQAATGVASTVVLLHSGEVVTLGELARPDPMLDPQAFLEPVLAEALAVPAPVRVWEPASRVVEIAAGARHAAAVTAEGALFTFGSGGYGQLGRSPAGRGPRGVDLRRGAGALAVLGQVLRRLALLAGEARAHLLYRLFQAYVALVRLGGRALRLSRGSKQLLPSS